MYFIFYVHKSNLTHNVVKLIFNEKHTRFCNIFRYFYFSLNWKIMLSNENKCNVFNASETIIVCFLYFVLFSSFVFLLFNFFNAILFFTFSKSSFTKNSLVDNRKELIFFFLILLQIYEKMNHKKGQTFYEFTRLDFFCETKQ